MTDSQLPQTLLAFLYNNNEMTSAMNNLGFVRE